MEDTPQSKRQNRSQPVKGDKSCLNCRILRIKCDRVIPICGACLTHPRKEICEYSDGSKESRKDFVAHILLADLLSKVEVRQQNSGNIARSAMAVSHREMSEGSGEHTGSSLRPSILPPCSKCRSRKVLCDGEQPCNHCRTAEIFQCDTRTRWTDPQFISDDYHVPDRVRPRLRRASSGNSSDGEASSGLSGFSDGGSDSSRGSSFSSSYTSPQRDWNLPTYDLQSHQLLLKDLDLTGQVIKLDGYPFESGGAADIYRGTLSSPRSGIHQYKQVAVKIFRRMHSDPETLEQTSKSLYEEARVWRQLKHPNVIPFLGISLNLGLSPALISPLCPWGPIMKYFQRNPKDRKEKLQMVIGVANGLAYLHSQGIVHGNLSTPVNTTSLFSTSIRFTAPESFSASGSSSTIWTEHTDVYSFSMVMLEILSGLQPYHHLPTEHTVLMHIVRGEKPIRTHLDHQVVTNRIWRFLTSLWSLKAEMRPEMSGVAASLLGLEDDDDSSMDFELETDVSFIKENEGRISSGEETFFEDVSLHDGHSRDLKGRVTQDDKYPFAGGGNSNIYRGKLTRSNGHKIRIAIKMIRVSDDGSGQLEEVLRRLKREVDLWSRLRHKNILPFIGVCEDISPWPVLISPFYKFGHVGTYLRKHPESNRQELAHGVASGLKFLHDNEIIHGDLKVHNVLIDKQGIPCICDFGISKIINRGGFTTSSVGTAPYMAPELFFVIDGAEKQESSPCTTKSSDIYSFGLLILEMLTSESPKGRPSRPIVTVKILAGLCPRREDYAVDKVTSGMWAVLNRCWAFEPQLRPTISEVLLSRPFLQSQEHTFTISISSFDSETRMANAEGHSEGAILRVGEEEEYKNPGHASSVGGSACLSRFPTTAMGEDVGRSIGLSARQVQLWLQNQRQNLRKVRGNDFASGSAS